MTDNIKRQRPADPYSSASVLSKLVFSWTGDLLAVGAKTSLEPCHIPECSELDDSAALVDRLMRNWGSTKKAKPNRLFVAMMKSFFPEYGWLGLLLLVETPLRIYQANLLGYLVNYFFEEPPSSIAIYNDGYILSALLVSTGLIVMFCHHQYFFRGNRLGMQMRAALSGALYKKSVKLHLRSLSKTATGKIVSLASQDVEILQFAGLFSHFIYVPLLEAVAVLYVGIQEVGISFFFGFVAILLMVPMQSFFSGLISKNRKTTAGHTDERIKLVNQSLMGVRVMKMNGWELAFKELVQRVRTLEVASLMRTNYLKAINEAIFFSASNVVACIVWVAYVRTGNEITPKKMFTVLSLLAIIQMSFTKFLTEAWVSLQRIQALLELDEVDSAEADRQLQLLAGGNKGETEEAKLGGAGYKAVPVATSEACEIELAAVSTDKAVVGLSENAEFAIVCKNMSGSWAPDADEGAPLVLSDLSYNVRHGELVVIVGQVGCAKTSLLMTVLQELTPSCGSVSVHCRPDDKAAGSIGYCSQEPWIMSSTIRSNILFGRDMDQKWYDEVVHACSLAQDFEMLSHGDLTVIGDRGVNLSGGQRARVGLARAVYGKSTLNLLDDPLSAVDPKVSSQLFHNAICGTMDGLTRVLVTHQTQYLSSSHVSRVMILNEGKIVAFDSYKALQDSGALSQWIDVLETQRRRRASSAVSTDSVEAAVVPAGVDATDSVAPDSVHVGVPEDAAAVVPSAGPEKPAGIIGEKVVGITAQEDRAEGSVGWGAYKDYCSFIGSTFMLVVLLVMLLLGQLMSVAVYIYMAQWSKMDKEKQSSDLNVNAYIILVVVSVVVAVVRTCMWFHALTEASLRMHDAMLASVLRAPIQFFDSNPVGRILNRFSKDIGFTDNLMPETVFDFVSLSLIVLSTLIVVAIGSLYILIILLPLIYVFVEVRKYYMKTAREVKRLESVSRSPVFSHLSESLDGLVTIRAFRREKEFVDKNYEHINNNTSTFFAYTSSARWLGFHLDLMCIFLFVVSTFGSVLANEFNSGIDPTMLAVGIMYVIQMAAMFQWTVRQSAEVENHMVSVERIVAYKNLVPEPPLRATEMTLVDSAGAMVPAKTPPSDWPCRGEVVVTNLSCSYRADLPAVIRDVSFKIKAGQRVGIVGRTGAGKSSLMSVLLRLIDINAGKVELDGINISDIGLHDLRPKVSVIPQVPFLFLGSIRQNLDMFGSFSDQEIWQAIDALSLRSVITQKMLRPEGSVSPPPSSLTGSSATLSIPASGLDALVAENGANFSVGERQLLCLCRAILQKNKVLIMDEATANVDMDTDREIQSAIRREFKASTVLMIAHRLQTVIDCDVVIVLADGVVVEMGHPHELLSKQRPAAIVSSDAPDCSFSGMVGDTGPTMSQQLRSLAKTAYDAASKRLSQEKVAEVK